MIDKIIQFFTLFYTGIKNFFKSIFDFIKDFIDWWIQFAKDFWTSLYDFIIELIPNLILILADILHFVFTDLLPSACDFCFGDWAFILNNNLHLIVSLPNSFGASLIYILNQCGFDDALKRLSCGVFMWVFLRVISLIRG